jgi:hypothetical protein
LSFRYVRALEAKHARPDRSAELAVAREMFAAKLLDLVERLYLD